MGAERSGKPHRIVVVGGGAGHIWALHGFWRMAPDTLARMIRRRTESRR